MLKRRNFIKKQWFQPFIHKFSKITLNNWNAHFFHSIINTYLISQIYIFGDIRAISSNSFGSSLSVRLVISWSSLLITRSSFGLVRVVQMVWGGGGSSGSCFLTVTGVTGVGVAGSWRTRPTGLRDLLALTLGLSDSLWAVQADISLDLSWVKDLALSPSRTFRYLSILLWLVSCVAIWLLVSASSEKVGVLPLLVRSPSSEKVRVTGVTGLSSDTAAVELSMGLNSLRDPLVVRLERLRSWDWVVSMGLFNLSDGLVQGLPFDGSHSHNWVTTCGTVNRLKRVAVGVLLTGVAVVTGARLGLGVRSRGSGEARLRWRQASPPESRLLMLLTMEGVGGSRLTRSLVSGLFTREIWLQSWASLH